MEDNRFDLTLTLEDQYRFSVGFDDEALPELIMDEPSPLGQGSGPNAARLLGAAIGNCLGASLVYCLRKAHIDLEGLRVRVSGSMTRNAKGRVRLGAFRVQLEPSIPVEQRDRIGRCLEIFEDFCMVTQSVREGLDVSVAVEPRDLVVSVR